MVNWSELFKNFRTITYLYANGNSDIADYNKKRFKIRMQFLASYIHHLSAIHFKGIENKLHKYVYMNIQSIFDYITIRRWSVDKQDLELMIS